MSVSGGKSLKIKLALATIGTRSGFVSPILVRVVSLCPRRDAHRADRGNV